MATGRASEARVLLDQEAEKCLGFSLQEAASMSDHHLLSSILQAESVVGVRERCSLAVTVLAEAGKLAQQDGRPAEGRNLLLKALQLSLSTLAWNDPSEAPAFVSTIQNLTALLSDEPIPVHVRGALMQHFERVGAYADAESQLFALGDELSGDPGVAELGRAFYQRLAALSDDALIAGRLPREETLVGRQEFHRKIALDH